MFRSPLCPEIWSLFLFYSDCSAADPHRTPELRGILKVNKQSHNVAKTKLVTKLNHMMSYCHEGHSHADTGTSCTHRVCGICPRVPGRDTLGLKHIGRRQFYLKGATEFASFTGADPLLCCWRSVSFMPERHWNSIKPKLRSLLLFFWWYVWSRLVATTCSHRRTCPLHAAVFTGWSRSQFLLQARQYLTVVILFAYDGSSCNQI